MTRSPVPAIIFLLAAGALAGAQLGKVAPLIPWYRDDQGQSLVFIGWLTSTIGLFVALAALPASLVIDRIGQFRIFAGGAVVLALGGAGLALFEHSGLVIAARAVEGLGYLVLVIVIPAILNAIAPPRLKASVLALWGGFVPVGFAVADFMALGLVPELGARAYLGAIAGLFAALALAAGLSLIPASAAALAPAPRGAAPRLADNLTLPVLLVTLSFGAFVVVSLSFFPFLPAAGERGLLLVSAGLIALTVPLGNVLAGWAMRGRGLAAATMLGMAGFAVSALAAWPAFQSGDPLVVTLAAILIAVSGGVTGSTLFASVPFIVPAAGSASVVIGLICQAGGIATLVAPPLAGLVIERLGWAGYAWLLVAASLAGLALLAPILVRPAVASPAP